MGKGNCFTPRHTTLHRREAVDANEHLLSQFFELKLVVRDFLHELNEQQVRCLSI